MMYDVYEVQEAQWLWPVAEEWALLVYRCSFVRCTENCRGRGPGMEHVQKKNNEKHVTKWVLFSFKIYSTWAWPTQRTPERDKQNTETEIVVLQLKIGTVIYGMTSVLYGLYAENGRSLAWFRGWMVRRLCVFWSLSFQSTCHINHN